MNRIRTENGANTKLLLFQWNQEWELLRDMQYALTAVIPRNLRDAHLFHNKMQFSLSHLTIRLIIALRYLLIHTHLNWLICLFVVLVFRGKAFILYVVILVPLFGWFVDLLVGVNFQSLSIFRFCFCFFQIVPLNCFYMFLVLCSNTDYMYSNVVVFSIVSV